MRHKLGPSEASAGSVNSDIIRHAEISEIKNLADLQLFERKLETEKLIEELQIRLSVINVDFARRMRETNDRERTAMEAKDKEFRYLREDSRKLVDEFKAKL